VNLHPTYKKRDLQGITIQTKLQIREARRADKAEYDRLHAKDESGSDVEGEEGEGDEDEDEEEKARRKKAKEEKQKKETWIAKEKVGVIGHYV
jgi:hypothetical protein